MDGEEGLYAMKDFGIVDRMLPRAQPVQRIVNSAEE
jgi:hypothetical protein